MKTNVCSLLLGSLLSLAFNTAYPSPLINVDDVANVYFDGSSSLVWQSNLFYENEDEEDGLILTILPGLEAALGSDRSSLNASIRASYEIQRIEERSELNDEYVHFSAEGSYDGARLDLNAEYSFDEEQTTAGEQNAFGTGAGFVELNVTRSRLRGEYTLSPKISFGSGINYLDREYKDLKTRLADLESYSLPADIFYELTPKLDLSFGYEYTFEEVGASVGGDFHRESGFLNFGARGALLPKLNGFFKVGYRTLNPEGSSRGSDQIFGISADLTYLATPKLTSRLRLTRDFFVGSEGQSVENTSARLDLDYTISRNYSAYFYTDLGYRDFRDGNDGQDFVNRTGVRFLYLPNQYWRFSAGYTYAENDSNRLGQGYLNNIADLSASLRY